MTDLAVRERETQTESPTSIDIPELTLDGMRRWLLSQGIDTIVGERYAPMRCPIATYLTHAWMHGEPERVVCVPAAIFIRDRMDRPMQTLSMPNWGLQFIDGIDSSPFGLPEVRAEEALAVLNEIAAGEARKGW